MSEIKQSPEAATPFPASSKNTQKIYVIDTNVLLNDPTAVYAFAEHKVVIPMTVLEELDNIKDRIQKDVSREARIAINTIDSIVSNAPTDALQEGVPITHGVDKVLLGRLAIYPDQMIADDVIENTRLLKTTTQQQNDNRIINTALKLQEEYPNRLVCLVTKDINMRLKARGCGLEHVEDYRRDKVLDDIDLLTKGYIHYAGRFWDKVDKVETTQDDARTYHRIPRSAVANCHHNMFVIDDERFIGHVRAITDDSIHLTDLNYDALMHREIWGLTPRNIEQAFLFYLLCQEDIDINIVTGPAGSGKTLLSLAYGLHAILEERRFDKMIVARSTPPIAEDIGFLPGTEEEKMSPWLAAFDDNLEMLHSRDESPHGSIEYVKEKARIEYKSLNFMRGRSFNNAYIIIDEAQGLTQFQLKSIITRVGVNSKIVVLGNLAQIDNRYVTPLTSGLTYLVDRFKNFKHAGVVQVRGIERSRLAAFAEENL